MSIEASTANQAGRYWAWVPALLLGSMLAGLGTLAYIAIDDPHFALEPDYYAKAVKWDQAQARAAESAASGIRLEVLQPLASDAFGQAELRLRVVDHEQKPLTGARVQVEAFPNAYAANVQHATLQEVTPGVYSCKLARASAGLWELRISIEEGSRHFSQALRQDISKGPGA
ncbi:MAG TPA: FixH family protein [Polyangiaceae bacterium]|nr:FixH family protein [Polyangiaceae bacterium]